MSAKPTKPLPEGWEWVRLGEICHAVNQRKPVELEPPVMSISKYDGFVPSLEYFSKQVFSKDTSGYKYVKDGQFAYSTIHLDEGSIAMFSGDEGCLISPMYTTFGISSGVDGKFLLYLLKSDLLILNYVKEAQGSVNRRKSVPFEVFAKICIPLPPLPVQRWIADALVSADEWLKVSEETLKVSDALTSRIADSLMEDDMLDVSEGETYLLDECCERIKVGVATSTTKHYALESTGVPMILNRSIKSNSIDNKSVEYISKEFDLENHRKRLMAGDVVVTRTGQPGLAAVVPPWMEGWQAFTTLILTPKPEIVRSEYLSEWINSVHGRVFVEQGKAGGAQKNLNAGEIEKMPVRLPSLEQQDSIVNAVSESRIYKKVLSSELQQSIKLKKALLHQLLSGILQPVGGWAAVIPELAREAAS